MAKLSATSREPEEYASATVLARETRQRVADQLRELIVEGDRMGSRGELAQRVQRVIEAERLIVEAQGRQLQGREHGLPVSEHAEAEREGRSALRSAVMALGAAAGAWVAALDHEHVRSARNGSSSEAAAF